MALPKEPRQKMINIMYLVLTAILALNVSSEILNAFKTIDDGFAISNNGLKERSATIIKGFSSQANIEKYPEKIAIWKPKAEKIRDFSDGIYDYIEMLKSELKKESGQKTPNGEFKEDDLEASTRLFLNGKQGQTKGEQLYAMLNQYKTNLASIDSIEEKVSALPNFTSLPKSYNKDNEKLTASMNPAQKWANGYFHMTPTVASLAILSKFQNDIRNSQIQLIEFCYSRINSTIIPINEFGVIASANATMVMTGDEVAITAGLGGYNKDFKPTITVDGATVPIGADGNVIYKMIASNPGEYTKHITATYINPNTGKQETKTNDVKFKVGTRTGLAVSVEATKVFYAGGDVAPNPIKISGAAGGAESIKVIAGDNVARVDKTGPGTYNIICTKTGWATLSVTDGKNTEPLKIKVKPLPDPKFAHVAGALNASNGRGGDVSVANFQNCYGLKAVLPDDFEFAQVKYSVKSFKITFTGKGFNGFESTLCNSGDFNAAAKDLLKRCVPGSSVQISSIVVQDNASGIHELPNSIGFNLR